MPRLLLAVLVICAFVAAHVDDLSAQWTEQQKIVDFVNSLPDSTWKAKNYGKSFKNTLGALKGGPELPMKAVTPAVGLPESFDSRTAWPACSGVIGYVWDQGPCGSCWAFGGVSAASDRYCIHNTSPTNIFFSPEDMVTCCDSCGQGCDGGYPSSVWDYLVSTGIVTGRQAEDDVSAFCQNYAFDHCDHHCTGAYAPCGDIQPTPDCSQECNAAYGKSWSDDTYYFSTAYGVPSDEASIQTEIMNFGPIEVAFDVYADFETYVTGIYKHSAGSYLGGHAVRMLGWGVENGVKYWLVANSWNSDWGEKGLFKIIRGVDECGIEDAGCAGMPKY